MTAMMPALAVTALLHERATAEDDLTDARGSRPDRVGGGEAKARRAQHRQAGRGIPPGELCVDVPTVVGLTCR